MSNNITVLGNLVREAEVKKGSKNDFLVFSLADNVGKDNTVFHECICFEPRFAGKFAEYLTKGKPLFIAGRLENDNYEKDGKTVYKNKIVVADIQFVSIGKKDEDGGSQGGSQNSSPKQEVDTSFDDDDIPF